MTGTAATALASTHLYLQEVLFKITAHKTVDHMDTSNSSARLSGSSCIPQSDTRSSVPELADANSIQVHSSSDSEDQLSDHNEDEAQPEVVSLLDMLKAPKASDLARKRKVQSNPPVGMKQSFAPKSITPYDRVKEHPGEPLTVTTGTLFCSACREQLSVKYTSHQASHKIC